MFSLFGKNNFNSISAHDLDDKIGKINLIDVREVYEYKAGHVPKAKNVPLGTIVQQPDKYLDK
jgi:rhodanese-related sulfurtransferase